MNFTRSSNFAVSLTNRSAYKLLMVASLVLGLGEARALAQQTASRGDARDPPIRVEISQPAEPRASWEKWITLIEGGFWPAVVIIGLFLFRKPLSNLLEIVGKPGTEISIGGLGIKIPTLAPQAQWDEHTILFRAVDTYTASTSALLSLFAMLGEPGEYQVVAVNLGRGNDWLSSRLYILTTMLQRMKGLRCIVFLSAGAGTEKQFIGAMTPEKVRWGLARIQRWLEVAYANAYAASLSGGLIVKDETGALDRGAAEELVKNFLHNLTLPFPAATGIVPEWVTFAPDQPAEQATWLSREYLERELGYALWKETILDSETKQELKSLMKCSAPYVARTKKNREFIDLIDRIAFLDEVMGRIGDKLGNGIAHE